MNRRDFLVSTAMFATATRQAMAQQSCAKMKRVAMVHPATKPAGLVARADRVIE